jgi:hypothetical protein
MKPRGLHDRAANEIYDATRTDSRLLFERGPWERVPAHATEVDAIALIGGSVVSTRAHPQPVEKQKTSAVVLRRSLDVRQG